MTLRPPLKRVWTAESRQIIRRSLEEGYQRGQETYSSQAPRLHHVKTCTHFTSVLQVWRLKFGVREQVEELVLEGALADDYDDDFDEMDWKESGTLTETQKMESGAIEECENLNRSANQHEDWGVGYGHEKIGGGPSVGQNFGAHKTVITEEVLMLQLPSRTGMIDTGCGSAVGGHDFHMLLQATMDSLS